MLFMNEQGELSEQRCVDILLLFHDHRYHSMKLGPLHANTTKSPTPATTTMTPTINSLNIYLRRNFHHEQNEEKKDGEKEFHTRKHDLRKIIVLIYYVIR